MKGKTVFIIFSVLWILVFSFSAAGQSLLDNPDYKKAIELQQMAEEAHQGGDYDKAYEYAEEAKIYLAKSDVYVAMMLLRYKAKSWKKQAADRIFNAKAGGAETAYPEKFTKAISDFEIAKYAFDSEEYEKSIEYSKSAYFILEGVIGTTAPLPGYYTVRLIPEDRDCFSKIAAYEFIYNDTWKWKVLYEANKNKIVDPDNPHLIHPGQVFIIPSIRGEKREGYYHPDKKYPRMPR